MKKFLLIIIAAILLAGCGNKVYDKAMEQGKLALANGEFEKALGSFELALDEKPKDKEAKQSYDHLVALFEVKEAIENGQWEEANAKANKLLKEETIASSIKNELKKYLKTAEEGIALSEKVNEIKSLVSDKQYNKAKEHINELKKETNEKDLFKSYVDEVNKLEAVVNEELKKQEEAKEEEKEEKEQEEADAISWSTYQNGRFGFTVKYPKGWILGPEPTNGDGRSLYKENDAEIITYANYYMEETKPDLSGHEKLKTSSGRDAYLLVTNDGAVVEFNGVMTDGTIVFYLVGTMSQEFYQENAAVLKEMLLTAKLN